MLPVPYGDFRLDSELHAAKHSARRPYNRPKRIQPKMNPIGGGRPCNEIFRGPLRPIEVDLKSFAWTNHKREGMNSTQVTLSAAAFTRKMLRHPLLFRQLWSRSRRDQALSTAEFDSCYERSDLDPAVAIAR